jgi:hypothetical protein
MKSPVAENPTTTRKSGFSLNAKIELQADPVVWSPELERGRAKISLRMGIANLVLLSKLLAGTLGSTLSPRIPQMGDFTKYLPEAGLASALVRHGHTSAMRGDVIHRCSQGVK